MFKNIPLFVKIILCIVFPPFFIIWIIFGFLKPVFSFSIKENVAFSNLVNNPCEENALNYIELMKNKPMFTFAEDNHPSSWAVLREKWYIINRSDKVPTDMKTEILDILIKKGLYLNNAKIIDNYEK